MKKINKKGFTLVELLLVIAIIGILAAVLFVSLGKQRERARITTFKENMRGLVTTYTACADGGGTLGVGDTADTPPACTGGSANIGNVPEMTQCDGTGTVSITAGDDDTGDTWGFQATCTTTDPESDCAAYCTTDGCQFCASGDLTWDSYHFTGDCATTACQ